MMKEMGANFLRISHYPQDDALLEMCDREGMLVWEEIPIVNMVPKEAEFADNCESMLIDMMRQHYNSPSVILWGYMNEIFLLSSYGVKDETSTERTLALAKRLEDVLHKEDPYRLSTMAFHGSDIYNTTGISEIPNVVGWNLYDGWYGEDLLGFDRYLANQHKLFPTHPLIVSEYGAGSDARIHSFHPIRFDFSIDYQQIYTEPYVNVIESTPYIMGASYWNMDVDPNALQRFVYDGSSFSLVDSGDKVNMGKQQTLEDFLEFCKSNYPADNEVVIFWDHGGASISGACYDEVFGDDHLTLNEIDGAFSNVYGTVTSLNTWPTSVDLPTCLGPARTCMNFRGSLILLRRIWY